MTRTRPLLPFVDQAEQAAQSSLRVAGNVKIGSIQYHGHCGSGAKAAVLSVTLAPDRKSFIARPGPRVEFTPAVSFCVTRQTQVKIDCDWQNPTDDGQTNCCGWLTDRSGVSWRIAPSMLADVLRTGVPQRPTGSRRQRCI